MKYIYWIIVLSFITGICLGLLQPDIALILSPLSIYCIKIIKLIVGPIIFLTLVTGICHTGSFTSFGKIGFKVFVYFEIISTLALLIGWIAADIFTPGSGIHASLDMFQRSSELSLLTIDKTDSSFTIMSILNTLLPHNVVKAFISGDVVKIIIIAFITSTVLLITKQDIRNSALKFFDQVLHKFMPIIVKIILLISPIAVLSSVSFATAKLGSAILLPLIKLIAVYYLTCLFFVFVILGSVCKYCGTSIYSFLKYLSSELSIIFATCSGETVLTQLMQKLEQLGCPRKVTGIVVPFGYSFNLDGACIYLTLTSLFIAQALGINLTLQQEASILLIAMLSSKGGAGVSGSGIIQLITTLSIVPEIPLQGVLLVIGVDRFMSQARSMVNFIGNGVATLYISKGEQVALEYT